MRAQLTASAGSKASAIRFSDNADAPIETPPAFTPEGTLVPGADNWACLGITPPRAGKGPVVSSAAQAADGTLYTASMGGVAYAFHDSKTAPPTDPNSLSKTWWGQFQGAGREGQMVAVLVQKGADVAGLVRLKSGLRRGPSGKIQGNQGSFSLTLGEPGCAIELTGTGSTPPTAVEGKFQGQDCKGQPAQGTFRLMP